MKMTEKQKQTGSVLSGLFQHISYRTQLFLISIFLIILPSILIGIFVWYRNVTSLTKQYNSSTSSLTAQVNVTLTSLLTDAVKIADIPILSDDAAVIMKRDYQDDYYQYAQDFHTMSVLFRQANHMNTNIISAMFINKYDQRFEYNINSQQRIEKIDQNLKEWVEIAKTLSNSTYFAPLQKEVYGGAVRTILPMVKILYNPYDYSESGIFYCEINFKEIEDLLFGSIEGDNSFMFLNNSDYIINYCTNPAIEEIIKGSPALFSGLQSFCDSLSDTGNVPALSSIQDSHSRYRFNGCVNNLTGWYLIQVMNDEYFQKEMFSSFATYLGIILFCILLAVFFAFILSTQLAKQIQHICSQLDHIKSGENIISLNAAGSNIEFRKLISGIQEMNLRLTTSMKETYQSQLNEQKSRLQMLQYQINHHFIYNTLNTIKSLSEIHHISEISAISQNMSDMLRYSLDRFPDATIEEEILQVRCYLQIQNVRFSDRYNLDVNIPESYLEYRIPVLTLLPLVENAVQHGFALKESNCYISITCQEDEGCLFLYVIDNGAGIPQQRLSEIQEALQDPDTVLSRSSASHHSLGISNVSQRLQEYFTNDDTLSIESVPGEGTIIILKVPL